MRVSLFFFVVLVIVSCEKNKCDDHEQDLIKLRTENQRKLDTGDQMLITERKFNADTDSVLNLIVSELKEGGFWTKPLEVDYKYSQTEVKVELDSLWLEVQKEAEEFGFASEISQLIWYGTSADYNYEKALELNRVKLELCNQ